MLQPGEVTNWARSRTPQYEVYVFVYAMCMHSLWVEAGTGCLLNSVSPYIFHFLRQGLSLNPKLRFCSTGWSGCFRELSVCLLSAGIIGMCCHTWAFYVGPRDPLLGSPVCVESTFQTEYPLSHSLTILTGTILY